MGDKGYEIPRGIIVMWSGKVADVPMGWTICDGNNGTPNLTDRFVIHADADASGTNNVGDTGGAKTHTLTGGESGTSAHTHGLLGDVDGAGTTLTNVADFFASSDREDTAAGGAVADSAEANADDAHTNRDKFHALAFIMKT